MDHENQSNPIALDLLVKEGRLLIERLAAAWRELGASHFGVWDGPNLLLGWPDVYTPSTSELIAPLRVYDNTIGFVKVAGAGVARLQAILQSEADLLSSWLQTHLELNAMTADLVENQDQLLAMYELSHYLRSRLDLQQILDTLIRQAVRLTKARVGFLWYAAPNEPVWHTEFPASSLPETYKRTLFEQACTDGQAILLSQDIFPAPTIPGLQVLYLIPIQIAGEMTAAMGLFFDRSAAVLSPDFKLAEAIARQSEAYIENARLHREALRKTKLQTELELARQIQTRLLPRAMPSLPGIETAAAMRPANEVGGDFYDSIQNSDQTFFFTLGDAAGKGMPAALLMSMTHIVFKSAARMMSTAGPQALLSSGVADLYDDFTETGLFVTAFACKYLPEQRLLLYANAGHAPVIFRPAGGQAYLLEADAPPLGVLPTSLSEDHSLPIHPGDLLIVATDGFNEAHNAADEMLGYERLLELTNAVASSSASEIVTAFYQIMDQFCPGCPQDDDQTIIVIKGV